MFEHSEEMGELAKALAKAQPDFGAALKDGENPHFRSKFATLASVWDAVRAPLTDNGLSVTQLPGFENDRIVVRTVLLHSSGQWLACAVSLRPVKDDPQGVGSAITYGRRYGLEAVTGIPREDDDGEAAMGRGRGQNAGRAPKAQRAPSTPRDPGPAVAELLASAKALAAGDVERAPAALRALERDLANGMTDDDISATRAAKWVRAQAGGE